MANVAEKKGYLVLIAAGSPKEYGPKVGWDTVWATRAEAEASASRAAAQSGWSARVIEVTTEDLESSSDRARRLQRESLVRG